MKPAPPPAARLRTAALVASVWAIAALPFVLGGATCPTARLFHFACPGCGMTRAFRLLADGDTAASLAMHPLAVPTAVVQVALAIATILAAYRFGAPWLLVRARWGRIVVGLAGAVLAFDLVVWIARALGAFGGPVPV